MSAAAMFRVAASRIEAGESYDSVLSDYGWVEAATVDRLRAENDALREALQEAIRLRVGLYRDSDYDDETDRLTDDEVANMDTYAKRWNAALAPREER